MRYTLRQLEVFLAVARHENVTRAASELGMSQSAASEALSELEDQFSLQLFQRTGKKLQLSEVGRSLRVAAERLQAAAEELEAQLDQTITATTLRIGATLSIGNYLVPPLMARFMAEQTGARVTLHVANTREVVRKVTNFELDLGIVEGEVMDPDLEVTRWRPDELVVFCAPDHPFAKKSKLTDRDLVEARWIMRESGSGTRQAFERAMQGILPELKVSLELQHTEAIKSAVKAGLGVGCVSRVALEDAFRHKSLVACDVPDRNFRRHFFFLLRRDKFKSAGIRAWLDMCRASDQDPPVTRP